MLLMVETRPSQLTFNGEALWLGEVGEEVFSAKESFSCDILRLFSSFDSTDSSSIGGGGEEEVEPTGTGFRDILRRTGMKMILLITTINPCVE